MSHFSKSCPTCKRVLPLLCATCPQCDSRTEESRAGDEAYNHMITIGMRISGIACALVIAAAISSRGRRPDWSDCRLMLLVGGVSAGTIWCALRALCGSTRRSLLNTALIPAFMIVAGVFIFREVSRAPAALAVPVAASAPSPAAAPLSQVATECFEYLRDQCNQAAGEVESARIAAMLSGDADDIETAQSSRARLTKLDQRMVEILSGMQKTEVALKKRLRSLGPLPRAQAALVAAVGASARDVARSADESIARQRRAIAKAQVILALLGDGSGRSAGGERRIIINTAADKQSYDKLLAEFDEAERAAKVGVGAVQQQCDEARRRMRAAGGGAWARAAAN
jgi:hypothetical protein